MTGTVVLPAAAPAALRRAEVQALTVGAVVAGSAFAAGLAGCAPTGMPRTDAALTALLGAGTAILGSRARPLALAVAALVAVVAGGEPVLVVAGFMALALAGALAVAEHRGGSVSDPAPSLMRVLIATSAAGIAVQVLLRLPFTDPVRGSALVAAAGLVPVVLSGWRGLAPLTRRRARRAVVGLAIAVAVAAGSGLVAAVLATTSLRSGFDSADTGLEAVRAGDEGGARADLRRAADDLSTARDRTRAWWALPARHLPLVAPQLAAIDTIAAGGASTASVAANGSARIDTDRLRLVDGRLDPAVVRNAGPVFADVAAHSSRLRHRLEEGDGRSVWQVPPVTTSLDDFTAAVGEAEGSARTGALAAEVGPALLGEDGEARYLVAFVSPSEARGTGFLGGYGVLTVTDGRIDLETVGRNKDLNAGGPDRKVISGPADYLARYSRFEPQSTWENVTFTPDGTVAAQVMAEMFPQSGGDEVDGVIRLDPTALSRMLRLTGPVEVENLPYALDSTNVEGFLQVEQYRLFEVRDERIDLLGDVAEATFDALTTGPGPAPAQLARALGPAVRGGHASLWLRSPRAQALVERLGATGDVPAVRGDGFGVITQNASGSKIDAFLQRTVRYSAEVDAETGRVSATAEIELDNRAPSSGEPAYLIGNLVGAPPGTNRTWLSIYSPLDLVSASVDGIEVELEGSRELGRNVWSAFLDVPPGATASVTVKLTGEVDLSDGRYRFDLLPQAMANPDQVEVEVTVRGGTPAVVSEGRPPGGGVSVAGKTVAASDESSEGTWALVATIERGG